MRSELTGTSGGAQTPLITVYAQYLTEAYPFMHQVYDRLMSFGQYCEYELLRAEQLYLEYCNYQQAANAGNDIAVRLWQDEAANTIDNLNDTLARIEAQLPATDYSLVSGGKYHLVSQTYGVDLWFDTGDGGGWPTHDLPTVDDYQNLNKLFTDYKGSGFRLLDCINEVAGTSIETPLWQCECEKVDDWGLPGPAILDLDDFSQDTTWSWSETTNVYARKGNTPAYHPGESGNALTQTHTTAMTYQEGWRKDSVGWWYQNADGTYPADAWKQIRGLWYRFDAAGYMQTGWIGHTGAWYYLDPTGAMHTGWLYDGGKWYFMDGSGLMQTGWRQLKGDWYFFDADGAMATGWRLYHGDWYCFSASGAMMAGCFADGWWLGSDGAWDRGEKYGWAKDAAGWWYGNASWYARSAAYTIDNTEYTFSAEGYWME